MLLDTNSQNNRAGKFHIGLPNVGGLPGEGSTPVPFAPPVSYDRYRAARLCPRCPLFAWRMGEMQRADLGTRVFENAHVDTTNCGLLIGPMSALDMFQCEIEYSPARARGGQCHLRYGSDRLRSFRSFLSPCTVWRLLLQYSKHRQPTAVARPRNHPRLRGDAPDLIRDLVQHR